MTTERRYELISFFPSPLTNVVLFFLVVNVVPAWAQDRRTVSEPALPVHVCATLSPMIASFGGDDQADTRRLQAAIDHCAVGEAVHLVAGDRGGRFVSGPLTIKSGITLWLEHGVVLAAIADPRAYDRDGHCGTIDDKGNGCRPFILFAGTRGGGIVGDGVIDGQGGATMAGHDETWWQLARRAQAKGGEQNNPRLIEVDHAKEISFYKVKLRNSPNFHVVLNRVEGATFWGVQIDTPADSRNTDGIDPGASQDITIAHSFIRTGDDNIALKAGNGPTSHVSIVDVHLYWGHGLSIGSETVAGVSDILVRDVTLDGTTSGLRIKSDISRGGTVSNVRYENVCLRGNRKPIDFDTHYDEKARGRSIPIYRDIVLHDVVGESGTLVIRGQDQAHALGVKFDGVRFGTDVTWQVEYANLAIGPGGAVPRPPGLAAPAGDSVVSPCDRRWAPFPDSPNEHAETAPAVKRKTLQHTEVPSWPSVLAAPM
ncbi:polygalacturonase [Rhizobium leguminosarum]|uniref:glycoside hydrolase family 28 protein n=1 Tax=Rhizobium leguminosarum TaxID=384 RepID=UPI001C96BCCF|nr:glycosyl hydrolase family 28 protein [Rhizobium leguminosarum]MBY5338586.1 polygalacturonase [Rhizobium leguminosarum]MBY5565613.1 polygalacturonase [Rhizobium leguminosarum]MBY5626482.1 polygalacturonase [Rhizobium leguminosarum]MBY5639807.1 polygalacturonase [Rhizobium leguminosarum]MBY5693996.1 polygalacturonase [Rhizobium leguminosarum]